MWMNNPIEKLKELLSYICGKRILVILTGEESTRYKKKNLRHNDKKHDKYSPLPLVSILYV